MNKVQIFLISGFILLNLMACTDTTDSEREHYYLKGYDQLVFKDSLGNPVPPSQYINSTTRTNGFRSYEIRDTSLTLVHRRSGEPYSGYIRTFHRNTYNLQGEYEDGKIFRLRYWHPNRTLGMDTDFKTKETQLWDSSGMLVASISPEETYYYFQGTQRIKEIRRDTIQSYFDMQGNLTRYTIFTDTTITFYYPDGQPRLKLPYKEGGSRDGTARRWHANGQLQAIGEYKDGQQHGTWIEYDSLGNEINREVFEP
ncbi:toxin-antitoxin system YwqK family antitoxin [Gracilimonas halophila]|uniref:Toxin-antitoxin system YwqK family antitoxin n=1 Tax=Gracilimonas halophila TaxID=1834464 RepID=A0ABW5JF81_9BACT